MQKSRAITMGRIRLNSKKQEEFVFDDPTNEPPFDFRNGEAIEFSMALLDDEQKRQVQEAIQHKYKVLATIRRLHNNSSVVNVTDFQILSDSERYVVYFNGKMIVDNLLDNSGLVDYIFEIADVGGLDYEEQKTNPDEALDALQDYRHLDENSYKLAVFTGVDHELAFYAARMISQYIYDHNKSAMYQCQIAPVNEAHKMVSIKRFTLTFQIDELNVMDYIDNILDEQIELPDVSPSGRVITDNIRMITNKVFHGLDRTGFVQPMFLTGETGSGKTEAVYALADVLPTVLPEGFEVNLIEVNLNQLRGLPPSELFATKQLIDGNTVAEASDFYNALMDNDPYKIYIILLDEFNRAGDEIANALMRIVDSNHESIVTIEGQSYRFSKLNKVFIATGNRGVKYTGAGIVDSAYNSRFANIIFDNMSENDMRNAAVATIEHMKGDVTKNELHVIDNLLSTFLTARNISYELEDDVVIETRNFIAIVRAVILERVHPVYAFNHHVIGTIILEHGDSSSESILKIGTVLSENYPLNK